LEISEGIHACIGLVIPTGSVYSGIAVNSGGVCFLFGPRDLLGEYTLKPRCIGVYLGLENP